MRVPQELGTPWRFHLFDLLASWWGARPKTPRPQVGVGLGRSEDRREGWYRHAKETKRGGKDDRESEHLIVPSKRGNAIQRIPRREGGAQSWAVGGKHGECIGTRSRVHETTTDS